MKIYVITKNSIEGFHYWINADESVFYLRNRHRHIFEIKCRFKVTDSDREIEIIQKQDEISKYIKTRFGEPAMFGGMSCEMIAKEIISHFEGCASCEVLEDGYGGAEVFSEDF